MQAQATGQTKKRLDVVSRCAAYPPEQGWLPPGIADELEEGRLSLCIRRVVERLDLWPFEAAFSEDGRPIRRN